MSNAGSNFFPAYSKREAQSLSPSTPKRMFHVGDLPKDVVEWNRIVELKKLLKARKRLVDRTLQDLS